MEPLKWGVNRVGGIKVTMPPVQSRRSFTASFKLEVITYAEDNGGNMAAQRKFGVSEKVIRGWRKQKDLLRQTRKTKKAFRGRTAFWPELEDKLEDFVLEQRAACRAVSTVQICLKAVEMAKTLNINNFTANHSWCFRFMKRKSLSIRQRTTLAQQLPADHQEKIESFRAFVIDQLKKYNINSDCIINMDEVPLTFDILMSRTVDVQGSSSVTISTTRHEKSSFTVVLACTASRKKLPPLIIFKRKTPIKEKLPSGIIVHQNKKGWMDNDVMNLWLLLLREEARRLLQAVQMPTCSRLHAYTYQRHHKRSHQSHRLHPCRYPRRPDEDPTAPGYICQQVLQDRDAEDVGELDVNWGKELHEHWTYAASIIPDRLPVGKRCVDGSPSLCHHQWIRESRENLHWLHQPTTCRCHLPPCSTAIVKVQTLRASIPMQTRDVLEHLTVM